MPALRLRFALLTSLALPGLSLAQSTPDTLARLARGELVTAGPVIPTPVVAGDADATQVVLDAANLGYLPSWSVVGLYSFLQSGGLRGPGGGGVYLASPVPYLSSLAVGGSVELVRPPDSFPYGNGGRLSLALAFRPLSQLSFGATYTHVFVGGTATVAARGLDTLDVSASARFGAYAAVALVVHDLPAPDDRGLPVQRVYQPELAFRPLGNARLELAVSARIGERRGDVNPAFRLFFMPYRGLLVRSALEIITDVDGRGTYTNDLRATVGLEVDFARVGLAAYALFGKSLGGGANFQGVSAVARLSGDRYPSAYVPTRYERIDLGGANGRRLAPTLSYLRRIERDPKVTGVLLVIGDLDVGWATTEELRGAIARLRAAGKRVFSFGVDLSMKAYFVAAAAERVFLEPAGGVRFVGLSTTGYYLKDALDLLSIKAEFVKIAEYKSAPEQFTRSGPSDEAMLVKGAILDDVNARVMAGVAADRHLDPKVVTALRDGGPYTPIEAKKAGLVDELKRGDEVEGAIAAVVGEPVQLASPNTRTERAETWQKPAVAVIFVEGDIVGGKSRYIPIVDQRFVGEQTLLSAIETARGDSRVKAIVLRVDSPGGSALASDVLSREIARTRAVKPVICSFGDVAASGGYFVAAGCDTIYAEPSTITGSIGIFSGKFDVSGLARRLGVSVDLEKRGPHADQESLFRPYTDEEKRRILEALRYAYERFLAAVSEGRHLKIAEVDAVGRGHVWTGQQALERKLVDHMGGLMDAVAEAKKRGGLDDKRDVELLSYPPEPTTLLGQLAELVGISLKARSDAAGVEQLLKPMLDLLRILPGSVLLEPSTPQARLGAFGDNSILTF